MEAHTPKGDAIERFIKKHSSTAQNWQIRVIDEQDNPVVLLEAVRQGQAQQQEPKRLEVHTRQVTLNHDELDDSTQKMIERWLASL